MLQLVTKKFFNTDELNTIHHKSILYSNYDLFEDLKTRSGSLSRADLYGYKGVISLVYEVDESWPTFRPDGTKEFMVSVGGDFLVDDFATVSSFTLNAIVTSNIDLLRRLTPPLNSSTARVDLPSHFVNRVFDPKIPYKSTDVVDAQDFFSQLVGLERSTYKAVMRAIRRYVVALHRISDDIDLAYSLFVASVESLAQEFDLFAPQWEDFNERKRRPLDAALENADHQTRHRVQQAILDQEHAALGRRFREFALGHLNESFFREEAREEKRPMRKSEIAPALAEAYAFRSQYVHQLKELPRNLTIASGHHDIEYLGRTPVLTLHGIARLVRHIIFEFVRRKEKVEHEDIDYLKDLPNTVQVQLASSFWLGHAEGISPKTGVRYLNGFIEQLAPIIAGDRSSQLTDVSAVMERIEQLMGGLPKSEQRLPLLTFYLLFNHFVRDEYQRPKWRALVDTYQEDYLAPSPESLLTFVLIQNTDGWSAQELIQMRAAYMKNRFKKGLNFGPFLDAALTLRIAEECRRQGEDLLAYSMVKEALEEAPGNSKLMELELKHPLPSIDWREYLLPPKIFAELQPRATDTSASNDEQFEVGPLSIWI